jgi:hypothetical protein
MLKMTQNKQIFDIRETAETLIPDKMARTGYWIGLAMILTMVITITGLLAKLPSVVPLYFTLPWGEARLGSKLMLYVLPGLSLLFFIINLAVSKMLRHLSDLLPRVLAVASAVVAGMMMLSLIGIMQSLIL